MEFVKIIDIYGDAHYIPKESIRYIRDDNFNLVGGEAVKSIIGYESDGGFDTIYMENKSSTVVANLIIVTI